MASEDQKLDEMMRRDWNRRIDHDYRFWMSDGYASDQEMWDTGARDLDILLQELPHTESKSLLEVGCGVGRLVKAAATRFRSVIGLDVSDRAISKAELLLGTLPRTTFMVGNGSDLHPIPDRSLDVVISFAALTSMPTEIIGGYLREMHRVLSPSGVVRLQMYVGTPQKLKETNTLHLRCFDQNNLTDAFIASGFEVEWIRDLVLPIKVSSEELGIKAVIISLKKVAREPIDGLAIARLLLPEGELGEDGVAEEQITVGDLEYWMTLNYARELIARGDYIQARKTVEYALQTCRGTAAEAEQMLVQLNEDLERYSSESAMEVDASPSVQDVTERNLEVIRRRFPMIAPQLTGCGSYTPGIEVKQTQEGPVIYADGQCLDHPSKPETAGKSWAERTLGEARVKTATHLVVFGFGGGYHLDAILNASTLPISVVEPRIESLWMAIRSRDLTHVLSKIADLSVGSEIPPFITERTELIVRPQAQVIAGEVCARIRAAAYGKRGLSALHPRIAVLGPMQGGTLPMVEYTSRALLELKQRVRPIDMSGFAHGYHVVDDIIREPLRKTVVHNAYLETLSQLVLESFTEKPFDILLCMAQAPISGRALNELRAKGVITVLWFVEDYQRFTYWRDMAKYYDFVFTIQRGECLDAIRAAGAGAVHYLPTACDPAVHGPVVVPDAEKARWGSPISFVGAGYHNRQQLLASLANLPFKIWGTEWPTCRPFDRLVQEDGRRLSPAEYVRIFNSSDININLHSSSERDGVDPFGDFLNPRTFELSACGAFQLVDERSLLAESFVPGEEVVTFKSAPDLKEKIQFYLSHPQERRAIAERARARVLRDHTYTQRLREMLTMIYSTKFEHLKRREEESPWHRLLQRAEKFPELHERCTSAFERGEEPILDGLVSDVITGKGKLTETEQILMFLFHIRKQIIRMTAEERGEKI